MHNHYACIYNELVWNVLKETVGVERGGAVRPFRLGKARNSSHVHWGGDCCASLRIDGGKPARRGVIGLSGFGFWSRDIGGFENTAPAHLQALVRILCSQPQPPAR